MSRMPLFPKPGENVMPDDYLRNYWCQHYHMCLGEAAGKDLLLDCSICFYKSDRSADFKFASNIP